MQPPRTGNAEKPLYNIPSRRKRAKAAEAEVKAGDSLPHAQPIAARQLILSDDGSLVLVSEEPAAERKHEPGSSNVTNQGTTTPQLSPSTLAQTTALPSRLSYYDPPRGIWLYHGNCLELLDAIAAKYPQGRFDCIFADPPYFLSQRRHHLPRRAHGQSGQRRLGQIARTGAKPRVQPPMAGRCQRVLKPDGTLWVTGTHHVIFSIGYAMQQLGFKLLNDIAWEKPNPPPNLSCRYFTHSTETVLWAAKNEKSKHVFNYDSCAKPTAESR